MVSYTNDGREKMLLKTDWVSITIATFGAGVVVYCGWSARNEHPAMKKILYTLLFLITVLWGLCAYILLLDTNG